MSSRQDRVLVGVLNNLVDLKIAREQHWYRIPVESARKWIGNRWPPRWLAFYQTKVFESEAFAVRYYAEVTGINEVSRCELFPTQPRNAKSGNRYYQIMLGPLQEVARPISSRKWRRIVFIRTTWEKFTAATEINDLFDESFLEDRLWKELKELGLSPERQEFVTANGRDYALDFAFYCAKGKLDVETDGDTWHADRARIPDDNRRDNDLETGGWKLLRFNSHVLNEQMKEYCIPTIVDNVKRLGGIDEGRLVPRDISADKSKPSQLGLFDD
ncbi:MAG TPA: DUF559 domain-containing protein [Candidatus Binatia bacterium]|nr:DUF559 domain-containing protein [Candidatus Binatia bacterium]